MSDRPKRHPFYYLGFAVWMCAFCIFFAAEDPIFRDRSAGLLSLSFAVLAIYLIWKFAPRDAEQASSAKSLTGAAGVLTILLGVPLMIGVIVWLSLLLR
jgi:hypothetical protein